MSDGHSRQTVLTVFSQAPLKPSSSRLSQKPMYSSPLGAGRTGSQRGHYPGPARGLEISQPGQRAIVSLKPLSRPVSRLLCSGPQGVHHKDEREREKKRGKGRESYVKDLFHRDRLSLHGNRKHASRTVHRTAVFFSPASTAAAHNSPSPECHFSHLTAWRNRYTGWGQCS